MKKTILATAVIAIVGLSGCASTTPETSVNLSVTNKIEPNDVMLLSSQKVTKSATQVEQNYLSAQNERYAYYAPASWTSVNESIKKMRTLVAEFDPNDQGFFGGPTESEVLTQIDNTQASLDKARRIKGLVSNYLAKSLADADYLSSKIQTQWQSELKNINNSINDIIEDIEDEGKTSGFETRRANIQARMLKLEIKMVKSTHYAPLLALSQKVDQDLIPKSYAQVKGALVKLNDSINLAPRNSEVINNLVSTVESDLTRASNVSAEVSWINSIDSDDSENIALRYRNAFEKLSLSVIEQDVSSLSYAQQMTRFESDINDQLAEQATEINGLKAKLATAVLAEKTANEVIEKAKEEAIAKATEEAVAKAKEEAIAKATEQAIAKAAEEAIAKATEEVIAKATEEVIAEAKDEATTLDNSVISAAE
ncbi:hypothetical protein [Moritella sp. Urea-trap-13]|uniref:hypothetical protein n=1 Tax=Moritella sp. Urea-trap-13 TaxID=2058327 RepID=UPI000C32251C|nr:hypothetical protein [Moritella sp. Urea-trap-13]PKH06094.1 hypothetical protein CXF93_09155 [Moritella sp. Urea-trap-13]